ncbi:hypothetical protein SRB5_26230 [Streptomyces sp. RB5]|uniref:Uncharacterized protein n=1 Tax=Streptomyces smaragdinus TaxID=2585196 RepID=A0A7K0CG89_9ACTN|nr:hypothetical protein [Streptomyces smaragdinus]MQY12489.1 hypothetical protein [Streptomyces smaragdinus]
MEQRLLEGLVFLVVDGTTGPGRTMAVRLCAHGARVAVVGVVLPGRPDDVTAAAALTCQEMTRPGRVALPYQLDPADGDAVGRLLAEVWEDLGPVSAALVVVPRDTESPGPPAVIRTLSARIAESLPDGCRHLELDPGRGGRDRHALSAQDTWAQRVLKLLVNGPEPDSR